VLLWNGTAADSVRKKRGGARPSIHRDLLVAKLPARATGVDRQNARKALKTLPGTTPHQWSCSTFNVVVVGSRPARLTISN